MRGPLACPQLGTCREALGEPWTPSGARCELHPRAPDKALLASACPPGNGAQGPCSAHLGRRGEGLI